MNSKRTRSRRGTQRIARLRWATTGAVALLWMGGCQAVLGSYDTNLPAKADAGDAAGGGSSGDALPDSPAFEGAPDAADAGDATDSSGADVTTDATDAPCTCKVPHGKGDCSSGTCVIASCDAGYADCDNLASTGCEVHVANDVNNCSACGKKCSLPRATASCVAGTCTVASCTGAYLDCNGLATDGCEVNGNTNNQHCGDCATVCSTLNGTSACSAGQCQAVQCNTNYQACGAVCCPTGFDCNTGTCRCKSNADCQGAYYGTCTAQGVCRCGLTVYCQPGEVCTGANQCG